MLQTKALYNLLRLNSAEDPTVVAEGWALEDLRKTSLEDLFERLQKSGIQMDRQSFFHFADSCDTPEELTELLLPDAALEKERDPFYLILFELWRRLVPEKQSLSIFCDELDYRIFLYDLGELGSDEPIQDALANLLEILDENADSGVDPQEVLLAISEYCAHDLESFILDYISDLLDSGNAIYASELIEGFSSYSADPVWFDFLRIRLISFTDIGDANIAMHRLLENDLELPLLLEAIRFLVVNGEHSLFKEAVQKAAPLLETKEEAIEVMSLIADYYRRLDEEEKEKAVVHVLKEHESHQSLDLKRFTGLMKELI
jgi:hypothetical protein